ncbi:GspE/PulE family protein [Pelagimonas varians]|uniref:Type II secretion system protein E n=1 Tax=Pelagimonas varians TaxID=696760 RepID=A0A238L1C7_9RHOB|nr:GspE/PulE family protein [Pelagimonas varians]PYG27234.1 general secretion pathway protein E [Pelagimonas varians]SMX48670.1 Putative type II secretion system protein E [Pelagimonas varians]
MRLPFAFAQDQQIVLTEGRIVLGPKVTQLGLREAQRRIGGSKIEVVEADQMGFDTALSQAYRDSDRQGETTGDDISFDLEEAAFASRQRDLLDEPGDAPVIQLVNQLLRRAVQDSASDLHIEPHEGGLRVRMRIDGVLQQVLDRPDVPVKRIVSRLKVMAGLDIAETRLPQDGRIPLSLGGRVIDTRVSSLPGHYGERIVLRILDRSSGLRPLIDLGLSEAQESLLRRLAAFPNGVILATGPTGAGKTTTLYSLLQLADRAARNIVTVEDPIEYDLPGVSQSQINSEIGMTFAAGLRATLRQDPDVILVGEIRDAETASTAAQAALTGHLVFSSLHANSSVGAIVRLRDLGLENFLIAATLRGVIAQRLLRKLCPDCRTARPIHDDEKPLFTRHRIAIPTELFDAQGCETCGMTGHAGRVGIFEITEVTENLRGAIDQGESEAAIKKLALSPHDTLTGQGLQAVADGRVSLAEALRIVGDVT